MEVWKGICPLQSVGTLKGQLQVLQNKAAKVLLNLPPRSLSTEALNLLDLKTLSKRGHFHCCVMMQQFLSGETDFKFDIRRNSIVFILIKTRRSNDFTASYRAHQLGQANFHFFKPLRTGITYRQ